MRLTEVSQMALPPGRLHVLEPSVGDDGATVPVSFDQRRHVGGGDRAGSWMALALRSEPVGLDRLADAWGSVVRRHGALRTAFRPTDDGGVALHEVEPGVAAWVTHAAPDDVRQRLREVLDDACRPFARPSHRLCVVEHDAAITLVVASDHAHVDMWSLAVVARDLLDLLDDPDVVLPPVRSFGEHTVALEQLPAAPDEIRDEWTRILRDGDDVMPRFPLPLGDVSEPRASVVVVRDVLDAAGSAALRRAAEHRGVTPLALALASMASATRSLADAPLRAVFPVHSRFEAAWRETVGWMITNSVLETESDDPKACHDAVKRSLELGSWPLADLLAPWGGMPEAPGMFAVSWLDAGRLPVDPALAARAQFVSASIRTDGVMIWFVTNDAGVHLRCRYPDTPEARSSLETWLDLVARHLRDYDDHDASGTLEP